VVRFNIGVTPEIELSKLTVAEKDALILSLLPLIGRLEAALARIAELEARLAVLEKPPKTPDNSSLPPSKGQKSDQPPDGHKPPRRSRPGFGRTLEPNPDRIVDRLLDACPHCAAAWAAGPQTPQQVYDRIELPPIKPDVTRVRLFGGRCACCGERAVATAPAGLEPGSPFGKSIEAIAVYLHYAQAIGIERLRLVFGELFGLSISEGALCNILARAQAPLQAAASAISALVTTSDVVASDETSVRVMKKTCWEWVFVTAACVLHIIRPSRGAGVVRALFGQLRPRVWISDSLGSQRGHADIWQVCLAHLLRDVQYAIDCGDDGFSVAFKRLLLRAIAIGRRRHRLLDTTLAQYRADLDRRLDRVLALPRRGQAAEKLRRRIARDREHLFVFITDRAVPATNNVSERALRPSVIFRKVTNGFRSEWGAQTYAAFRSVVSTAKTNNRSVLADLRRVLATPSPSEAMP
jgi:transposase